jgi:hypothetical protein
MEANSGFVVSWPHQTAEPSANSRREWEFWELAAKDRLKIEHLLESGRKPLDEARLTAILKAHALEDRWRKFLETRRKGCGREGRAQPHRCFQTCPPS